METILVDGKKVRIHRQGQGAPLVYLHSGYGEGGPIPFFDALAAAGIEVTAPLLPGFGGSEPARDLRGIADNVFHLRRILDILDIGPASLVGSSLGGWMAAEIAVWFPERVQCLVLIDAFGLRVPGDETFEIFGSPPREVAQRALPHGGDVAEFIRPVLEDPEVPDAVRLHFFHALEATARIGWNPYLHDPKLPERLAAIRAPTLVVWGADDGIVSPAHGRSYSEAIPGAALEILDRCGHLPALEQPTELATRISSFVRDRCSVAG